MAEVPSSVREPLRLRRDLWLTLYRWFKRFVTEIYALWVGFAHWQSPISLIPGFNWISGKAVKRIIWYPRTAKLVAIECGKNWVFNLGSGEAWRLDTIFVSKFSDSNYTLNILNKFTYSNLIAWPKMSGAFSILYYRFLLLVRVRQIRDWPLKHSIDSLTRKRWW